jgi:glycosyltransferase involved in cell wall biosynthesis
VPGRYSSVYILIRSGTDDLTAFAWSRLSATVNTDDDPDLPIELSVIVPVFNEAATIAEALRRLDNELRHQPLSYELIVVSDGSTDATPTIVDGLAIEGVRLVHYDDNRGKGAAVKTGAALAAGRIIAFIDGDLDIHPRGLVSLVGQLESSGADVVVGSKVHPDSIIAYPLDRRIRSKGFRLLARTLFSLDVSDSQTGLKVFRSTVARDCLPKVTSTGYAFDLEFLLLAKDLGYRLTEGPVEVDYQPSSPNTGASAVVSTFREVVHIYRLRRNPQGVDPPLPGTPSGPTG